MNCCFNKVRHSILFLPLLTCLVFTSNGHAAAYRIGIAPSLPEPVEDLKPAEDDSLEAKIRRGLKVKGKTPPTPKPAQNPLTPVELPTKYQAWHKLLALLTEETGIEFELVKAKSELSFELGLAKGRFDFAYTSPLQFIAFKEQPGYKAIAKRKTQPIRGIIFVKKNSSQRSLTQLRNETFAFPSPIDFPGSIAIRHSLQQLDFGFEPVFFSEPAKVYTAVAQGEFVAGGGTHETFKAQPPEIRNTLHIIWDSPGYTPYPFIAHPRVPFLTIIKLQRALANIDKNENSKTILKHIFADNGFEVAKDTDWHDAELIDLNQLNRTAEKERPDMPAASSP